MSHKAIHVLCADDTAIAAEGMQRILSHARGIKVLGTITVREEIVRAVEALRPDVLLLDQRWRGVYSAGRDVIREVKARYPEVRIIAITVYEHLAGEAKSAGADEVVTKDIPAVDLVSLIRQVATGPPQAVLSAAGEKDSTVADSYAPYEVGLQRLLGRLDPEHPCYTETCAYQQRLVENIAQTRHYGDTETRRAERNEILARLDRLARDALGTSFNDLQL